MSQVAQYFDQSSDKVIVVGHKSNEIVNGLVSYMSARGHTVVTLSQIPSQINNSNKIIVFSNEQMLSQDLKKLQKNKDNVIILSLKSHTQAMSADLRAFTSHHHNFRIISIENSKYNLADLTEKLVRFSFAVDKSHSYIQPEHQIQKQVADRPPHENADLTNFDKLKDSYVQIISNPKKIIAYFAVALGIIYTAFILPLLASIAILGITYRSGGVLHDIGRELVRTSSKMYSMTQGPYAVLGVYLIPQTTIQLTTSAYELISSARKIILHSQIASSYIIDRESDSKTKVKKSLVEIKSEVERAIANFRYLNSNIPESIRSFIEAKTDISLKNINDDLEKVEDFLPYLGDLLGETTDKTYVLFFANNFELRPGGGFIGSFAVVRFGSLQLQDFKVYDVYDADGQLKARIAPPDAISRYLSQPFYFLRDSAFTGDFPTNSRVAFDFLDREINLRDIDGSAIITTSAVIDLVRVLKNIELEGPATSITPLSAYITLQSQSEQDFFEGSTQKKTFISKLYTELIIRLSEARNTVAATESVLKSFKSKHIAVYFKDLKIQGVADKHFMTGRQISPSCIKSPQKSNNCHINYIYPLHANLGVNKANAFVTESYKLIQKLKPDNTLNSTLEIKLTNTLKNAVYPGGTYKNYMTIPLPSDVVIQSVSIDGVATSDYSTAQNDYSNVSIYVEVPIRTTKTVSIDYMLPASISSGDSLQVIIQKQIGSKHTPFYFEFQTNDSLPIKSTNLPLEDDRIVKYNSILNSDLIYHFNF